MKQIFTFCLLSFSLVTYSQTEPISIQIDLTKEKGLMEPALNVFQMSGMMSCSRVKVIAQQKSGNPEDNLPADIRRITRFGERADFSHDGKKILFVGKTYGDVFEVELATGKISLITGHFYHGGFTRALYLANDDVLLSGCTSFDAANPHINRQNTNCSGCIDIWKLKLDGSGQMDRLTFFSNYKGYKSSNPVVSDDGKFMAFQMARSTDLAGIGYGIFIMELKK